MDDTDPELIATLVRTTLFARLNPSQKARVVGVLREQGHTVGFLGDGINDALALREADVGISVDSGSDLAKDVADIILTEKSLGVIHYGILQGRITHGNTVKYIKMAASSNFGNVFSVLVAAGWLKFLPMKPVQLLTQNLIYDISQLAIPWDRMDPEFLSKPQPWSAMDIAWFMLCFGPLSSIFDILTFAFNIDYFHWFKNVGDNADHFQSCWFLEGLLTQTLIVHMIRTEKIPFLQSRASWQMCLGTFFCCVIAFAIPNTPLINEALSMKPIPGMFYAFLLGTVGGYMLLANLMKFIYIKLFGALL